METDKQGFTLVELLVAIAITSIVLVSVGKIFISSSRVYTTQDVAAGVQQRLRAGINFMVRDIRMAGLDPSGMDIFGIEVASSQNIRITADRNSDGNLDDPDISDGIDESDLEQMAYEYDGNSLLEQVLYKKDGSEELRETLIDSVTGLTFTYFNDAGAATAVLDDIRTVVISMTVREPAGRDTPVNRTLTKRVICRNLCF